MTSDPAPASGAKRAAALRQRREAQGIKQLAVWAHIDDHAAIKALVAQLAARRLTANQRTSNDHDNPGEPDHL